MERGRPGESVGIFKGGGQEGGEVMVVIISCLSKEKNSFSPTR